MKTVLLSFTFAAALASSASAANLTLVNVSGGAVSEGIYAVGNNSGTANTNSWPAGENPPMATDGIVGGGNKYLNFAKLNTGFVVNTTGASSSLILNSLTFATGNDAPERDPLTFTLYGSTTPLAGGNLTLFIGLTLIVADAPTGLGTDPGRNTFGAPQTFTNNTAFAGYVLYFPTVRDGASANSMQISDVTFSGVPEPGTCTLSGLALLGFLRRRR